MSESLDMTQYFRWAPPISQPILVILAALLRMMIQFVRSLIY